AISGHGLGDDALHIAGIAGIALRRPSLVTLCADKGGGFLGGVVDQIGHDHPCTLARQEMGDRTADVRPVTKHDGDLVLQSAHITSARGTMRNEAPENPRSIGADCEALLGRTPVEWTSTFTVTGRAGA